MTLLEASLRRSSQAKLFGPRPPPRGSHSAVWSHTCLRSPSGASTVAELQQYFTNIGENIYCYATNQRGSCHNKVHTKKKKKIISVLTGGLLRYRDSDTYEACIVFNGHFIVLLYMWDTQFFTLLLLTLIIALTGTSSSIGSVPVEFRSELSL